MRPGDFNQKSLKDNRWIQAGEMKKVPKNVIIMMENAIEKKCKKCLYVTGDAVQQAQQRCLRTVGTGEQLRLPLIPQGMGGSFFYRDLGGDDVKRVNDDVRKKIRDADLYQYQIAEQLGMSTSNLQRILQHTLTEQRRKQIDDAIDELLVR